MKKVDELSEVSGVWRTVREGRIETLEKYELTIQDVEKMSEFFIFFKKMKREKHNGLTCIHQEDAKRLLEYFEYFGVDHWQREHDIGVLYEYHDGYESSNDILNWYILESWKCPGCGAVAKPFAASTCRPCHEKKVKEMHDEENQ